MTRVISQIQRIHPLYGFRYFSENFHFDNGYFRENFENHIEGEFVKIQKFTLVIIFVISPQKWAFQLKNESFKV